MGRWLVRVVFAMALVTVGWVAARGQEPPTPDFELFVVSLNGKTTIECVRGCSLQWVEREVPDRENGRSSFTYGPCGGVWPDGCPSGRLGGWIQR
jgi:hypothetical protein